MISSALCGQTALNPLPPLPIRDAQELKTRPSLQNFEAPVQLKWGGKRGTGGMDVYKVSKTGKRQARSIAISSDNRAILISTNAVKNMFRRTKPIIDSGARRLEISSIDRIVRGQVTNKFLNKTKSESLTSKMPVAEEHLSLSIVFRVSTASASYLVEEDLLTSADSTNAWGSLDLVIPSHNDYETLVITLQTLMDHYRTHRSSMNQDILLLQHHWMEIGKTYTGKVNQSDWTSICFEQLSVPLTKLTIQSLYRKYCSAMNIKPESGLPLVKAIGLLEHTRELSVHNNKSMDPCEVVWNLVLKYNLEYRTLNQSASLDMRSVSFSVFSYYNGSEDKQEKMLESDEDDDSQDDPLELKDSAEKGRVSAPPTLPFGEEEVISATAFLRFLRDVQKERKITIAQVRELFARLNSQTSGGQLMDDGFSRKPDDFSEPSKEYITKSVFCNYLRCDANDAFDPERGLWEQDDMNQPLSSYWINSSHDTYLKNHPPMITEGSPNNHTRAPLDVKMYTTALHRGCRCLELDVWDGEGRQRGEPVVRFGTDQDKATQEVRDGLFFHDILKAVRSFLISNVNTLPIMLMIETHCSRPLQEVMASHLRRILGSDDLLHIPPSNPIAEKERVLPTPNELRGKVVVKCKIPQNITEDATVIFDDYDHENDLNIYSKKKVTEEDDIRDSVPGLEAVGSVISESPHSRELTPDEMIQQAIGEAEEAMAAANSQENHAFKANVKARRAEEFATQMLSNVGMTLSEADKLWSKPLKDGTLDESAFQSALSSSPALLVRVNTQVPVQNSPMRVLNTIQNDSLEDSDDEQGSIFSARSNRSTHEVEQSKNIKGHFDDALQAVEATFMKLEKQYLCPADDHHWEDESRDGHLSSASDMSGEMRDVDDDLDSVPSTSFDVSTRITKVGSVKRAPLSLAKVTKKTEQVEEVFEEQGIEVQHFFSSTVEQAVAEHAEADAKSKAANDAYKNALSVLEKSKVELDEVTIALADAKKRQAEMEQLASHSVMTAAENKQSLAIVKERVDKAKEELEQYSNRATAARTVAATAATEAKISEQRAMEAERRAKRAQQAADANVSKADAETKKEEELTRKSTSLQAKVNESIANVKKSKQKLEVIVEALFQCENQIKAIEYNQSYQAELSAAQQGVQEEGRYMKKHKVKVEERTHLTEKQAAAQTEKDELETTTDALQNELIDLNNQLQAQSKKAEAARTQADHSVVVAEQLAEYADEERDAASMRHVASEKADANLQKVEAHRATLEAEVEDAERVESATAQRTHQSSLTAEKYTADAKKAVEVKALKSKLDSKAKQMKEAEKNYTKTWEEKEMADKQVANARSKLDENAEMYYKAKVEASARQYQESAQRRSQANAISSFKKYRHLRKIAEESKAEAVYLRSIAADKASAVRHARDYKEKKSKVKPIAPSLAKICLLHSNKFRYWEKSLTMPFHTMHSISEGKMMKLVQDGEEFEADLWREFNKNHMTRIYPSRHKELRSSSSNFNPVLPWSLGCQIASMNQQVCDAFVLINDGRFRVNGSCGYVLKPSFMIESKNDLRENNNSSRMDIPQTWSIKVLSGFNLPKPRKKALMGPVNPRVRVTLYDGGNSVPIVHLTETVRTNGFNPIWDEKEGATFNVLQPGSAIVLFSLWDWEEGSEDFIAAAAMPVSCMRTGYRSVPLFDSNHMRCGAHGYSSLFIQVELD